MELGRRGDNGGEAVELGRRAWRALRKAAKIVSKVEDPKWLCPYYYGH